MSGLLKEAWQMEQKRSGLLLSSPPPVAGVPLGSSAGFFFGWAAAGGVWEATVEVLPSIRKYTRSETGKGRQRAGRYEWNHSSKIRTYVKSGCRQLSVSGSWHELCPGSETRPSRERRTSCYTHGTPSTGPCLHCCSPANKDTAAWIIYQYKRHHLPRQTSVLYVSTYLQLKAGNWLFRCFQLTICWNSWSFFKIQSRWSWNTLGSWSEESRLQRTRCSKINRSTFVLTGPARFGTCASVLLQK